MKLKVQHMLDAFELGYESLDQRDPYLIALLNGEKPEEFFIKPAKEFLQALVDGRKELSKIVKSAKKATFDGVKINFTLTDPVKGLTHITINQPKGIDLVGIDTPNATLRTLITLERISNASMDQLRELSYRDFEALDEAYARYFLL